MYTLETLCRDIRLAPEATARVLELEKNLDLEKLRPAMEMLRQEEHWEQGLAEIKKLLGEDPAGFGMLTCMLLCGLEARTDFEKLGFSREIYVETMGCFSRFVGEHIKSFGRCGFDRDFWTVRQVSARLFRIGQLEYELTLERGQKVVSLHIPSDASLSLPGLRKSWEEARKLLLERFPDYAEGPWICGSWLLSPNLKDMLPVSSRILGFQRSFRIVDQWQEEDFKEWVWGRTDIPNEDLAENTSLQKKLKAFLLAGGAFISAGGILSEDPFRE